jgi:hypothetical protein
MQHAILQLLSNESSSLLERPPSRSISHDQPLPTPDYPTHHRSGPQHGRLPLGQIITNAPTTFHHPHPHGSRHPTPTKSTGQLWPSESIHRPPRQMAQPQSRRSILQAIQILSNMGFASPRSLDQVRSTRSPDTPAPRTHRSFQHSPAS